MILVDVVGVGLSPADLTQSHLGVIRSADVLVGGRRQLNFFPGSSAEKIEVGNNLKELVSFIQERMKSQKVVVLASGDPLFHGIGAWLVKTLGPDKLRIFPNVSSMTAAFARIKTPWHDAALVSVHGGPKKPGPNLDNALEASHKIGVLTDPDHGPDWVASRILEKKIDGFAFWVASRLGTHDEKVARFDVKTAANMTFDQPNCVVLIREGEPEVKDDTLFHLGMDDDLFHHSQGLITKAEVRTVTLSRLRLNRPDLVLWDLGAGSGSVGVEAARILVKGGVSAVEKRPDRVEMIRENARRFEVHNLEIHCGELPRAMAQLPDPDRVFIGGGGKNLAEIIRQSAARLAPGGEVVVNTVLVQSLNTTVDTLQSLGMETKAVQVQVSRGAAMPAGLRFTAQNPVWIVSGTKKQTAQQAPEK